MNEIIKIDNSIKKCPCCKKEKSIGEFYLNKARKNNLSSWCKACQKKMWREYYHKSKEYYKQYNMEVLERAQSIITQVKELGCSSCFEMDERTLEFHHVNPKEKRFNVGRSHGVTTLIKEMEKCILLCANCHRKGY